MKLHARAYRRNQPTLLPNCLEDYVSEDHEVRLLDEIVESLDLEHFYQKLAYTGRPSYHPLVFIKVLFYGLIQGVTSSRHLMEKLRSDLYYMFLAKGEKPDFRTISDFRKNNLQALSHLFSQVLILAQQMEMIGLSHLSIDGCKIRANASVKSTYDEKGLGKATNRAQKEMERLLEEANRLDKEEDKLYGKEKTGHEVKKKYSKKEKRLEKLRRLREELEDKKEEKLNLTDKDAKIHKVEGRKVPGYNGQVAVDEREELIVAIDLTDEAHDSAQLIPMVKQVKAHFRKYPDKLSADAGYSTYNNLEFIDKKGIDGYVPDKQYQHKKKEGEDTKETFDRLAFTYDRKDDCFYCKEGEMLFPPQKQRHRWPEKKVYKAFGTDPCSKCRHFGVCTANKTGRRLTINRRDSLIINMREKLDTEKGKEIYQKRSHLAETPFAHIKKNLRLRQFSLRGFEKVKAEFVLWCTAYNLKKIIGYQKACLVGA